MWLAALRQVDVDADGRRVGRLVRFGQRPRQRLGAHHSDLCGGFGHLSDLGDLGDLGGGGARGRPRRRPPTGT